MCLRASGGGSGGLHSGAAFIAKGIVGALPPRLCFKPVFQPTGAQQHADFKLLNQMSRSGVWARRRVENAASSPLIEDAGFTCDSETLHFSSLPLTSR